MDKTSVRSGTFKGGAHADERYVMNLAGVDARHMGVEVNATFAPVRWFELTGMLSLGNYEWASNAKGYFYNLQGQPIKTNGDLASGIMSEDHAWGVLNQKGIKVGGSAQTTAAIGATFRPWKGFRIGADWKANARNYSDYSLSVPDLGKEISLAKPWQIPWGNQFDLHASWNFNIGGVDATLYGNVHNLFNYNYVVDAWSNSSVDGAWNTIYGTFYSFGRTYSMKLRVNF